MNILLILCFKIILIEFNAASTTSDAAFVLYSDADDDAEAGGDIRKAQINKEDELIISSKRKNVALGSDSEKIYGIDYSLSRNLLLWNSVGSNIAVLLDIRGQNTLGINVKKVLNKQKSSKAAIALDWIHDLLYFSDNTEIHVISIMNTNLRYVVIENGFDIITNIAIDPLESFIFWIDSGNEHKIKIKRSNQDGSAIKELVISSLRRPQGIALDLQHKRVYWIDEYLYTLSSIDYNGNNKLQILKSQDLLSNSYRMDFFEDYIYWVNDNYKSVLKTHKSGLNGTTRLTVIKSNDKSNSIIAMKILHLSRQPFSTNRCLNSNCSHLCLPNGINSFRCLCPSIRYYKFEKNESCSSEIFLFTYYSQEFSYSSLLFVTLLVLALIIEFAVIVLLIVKYVKFDCFRRKLSDSSISNIGISNTEPQQSVTQVPNSSLQIEHVP